MHFHIITLFPESLDSYIHESIIGRALRAGKIKILFYNPRDFAKGPKKKSKISHRAGKHKRVDRKPYGGGPGMVIEAEPVLRAVGKAIGRKKRAKIIFLSPSGKQFNNKYAHKIAKTYKDIVIISGHYEGIDARVKKVLRAEEISIGPYILTGGELPAMIIVDSISRHIRGVLGSILSIEEKRVSSRDVYTRPEVLIYKKKKYRVPKVLLSGHHKKIEAWKKRKR